MGTKESTLEILERSRGESVSGSFIAEQLKVSRNAVWKAIKELEKEGYVIEAITNKGYCLAESNDILSVQGMLPFLIDKGLAGKIHIFDTLESTNKTAKELAINGAENGTVVIANYQTAGKGRFGREFYSPANHGIYISFILKPEQLLLEQSTLITAFAATSVCEAIEAISKEKPKIKWVNDIYLDRKKVGGILTEAITDFESGNVQWIVVGIGLNYSVPSQGFPEELEEKAGSIFPNGYSKTKRNQLAAEVVNRIVSFSTQMNKEEIINSYRKRSMMLGKRIAIKGYNESYEALAVDIDDAGRLIIEKDNGERTLLHSGEVSIIV